jgi:hypothetical protein
VVRVKEQGLVYSTLTASQWVSVGESVGSDLALLQHALGDDLQQLGGLVVLPRDCSVDGSPEEPRLTPLAAHAAR